MCKVSFWALYGWTWREHLVVSGWGRDGEVRARCGFQPMHNADSWHRDGKATPEPKRCATCRRLAVRDYVARYAPARSALD